MRQSSPGLLAHRSPEIFDQDHHLYGLGWQEVFCSVHHALRQVEQWLSPQQFSAAQIMGRYCQGNGHRPVRNRVTGTASKKGLPFLYPQSNDLFQVFHRQHLTASAVKVTLQGLACTTLRS